VYGPSEEKTDRTFMLISLVFKIKHDSLIYSLVQITHKV